MTKSRSVAFAPLITALALAVGCARNEPPPAHQAGAPPQMVQRAPAVGASETSADVPRAEGNGESQRQGSPPVSAGTTLELESDRAQTAAHSSESSDSAAAPAKRAPVRTPDVIYVPTPQLVVDKMLELAKPKKTDVLYDLGCGDGRIVVTAAKKYGIKAVGFDIDPQRVDEALENVRKNGVEDLVTIEEKDVFTLDLSPANIVTLYLLPELNVKLIPQLEKLRPGSRVVTHDFDIDGIQPLKTVSLPAQTGTSDGHDVYLFTIPFQKTTK